MEKLVFIPENVQFGTLCKYLKPYFKMKRCQPTFGSTVRILTVNIKMKRLYFFWRIDEMKEDS